jgi:protein SCO1/2
MNDEDRNEMEGSVPPKEEASLLNRRTLLLAGAGLLVAIILTHILAAVILSIYSAATLRAEVGRQQIRETAPVLLEPRLQVAPLTDLQTLQATERARLDGYGWIDREAGVVRIPIERAMQLVVERGLPVAPGGGGPRERIEADESGFLHPTEIPPGTPGPQGSPLLEVTVIPEPTGTLTPASTQIEEIPTAGATQTPGAAGTPAANTSLQLVAFRDGDHSDPPNPFEDVGFDQKLDAQVPLELTFLDEAAKPVRLSEFFGRKPVVLLFAYYECPMLCTQVLNALTDTLKALDFTAGEQFEVVVVSMDPGESSGLASAKKATYLEEYNRPGAETGWHFLTGEEPAIQELAQAVGFRYRYDADLDQYAHPTGIMVLTPQGKISRYFYGIEYSPTDLRLGLVEASTGKIGSLVDQFYLLCYAYNPVTGRYNLLISNVLRLAALATILFLGLGMWALIRRERSGRSPNLPDMAGREAK